MDTTYSATSVSMFKMVMSGHSLKQVGHANGLKRKRSATTVLNAYSI